MASSYQPVNHATTRTRTTELTTYIQNILIKRLRCLRKFHEIPMAQPTQEGVPVTPPQLWLRAQK